MSTPLTARDVLQAWRGSALLQKSVPTSPGLPIAPRPKRPHTPRPPAPYDLQEDARRGSMPYQFVPHKLGDLYELHQQDAYELQKPSKVRRRSFVPRSPSSFTHLMAFLQSLHGQGSPRSSARQRLTTFGR